MRGLREWAENHWCSWPRACALNISFMAGRRRWPKTVVRLARRQSTAGSGEPNNTEGGGRGTTLPTFTAAHPSPAAARQLLGSCD
eukprot:scaffold27557_cov101-Isochrysis_galbana.AAC.1